MKILIRDYIHNHASKTLFIRANPSPETDLKLVNKIDNMSATYTKPKKKWWGISVEGLIEAANKVGDIEMSLRSNKTILGIIKLFLS